MARVPKVKKKEEGPSLRRRVNLVQSGDVYGEWTVAEKGKKPDYLLCKCSCGTEREVHVYSLTSKKSVSCGCLRKKRMANANAS